MKQLSKKMKNLFTVLIAVLMLTCVTTAIAPTIAHAQDEPGEEVYKSGGWYELSYSEAESRLELLLSDSHADYKDIGKQDVVTLKNELISLFRDMFVNSIFDSATTQDPQEPEGHNIALMAFELPPKLGGDIGDGDIGDIDPDDFWAEAQGNPAKFKEYITQRLSEPEEFSKFANGDYDMLVQQVVGEYIQSKKAEGKTDEDLDDEYEKIQDAIDKVLDEVTETVTENYKTQEAERDLADQYKQKYGDDVPIEEVEKFVQENLEQYKQDHAADLQNRAEQHVGKLVVEAEKRVNEAITVVVENGGAAPSLTVQDILTALQSVDVNGHEVITKDGTKNIISDEGMDYVLQLIPTMDRIAEMTSYDLNKFFNVDLKVVTTYGDLEFNLNVGFMGKTDNIQQVAKVVARHIKVKYDAQKIQVNITAPQIISDFFRAVYNSTDLPLEDKEPFFDFFNHSIKDFASGVAYTFEDLDKLLHDINYQHLFANFIYASSLNEYFGSYIQEFYGTEITPADIINAVRTLRDKAIQIKDWTDKDIADYLSKIPGLGGLASAVEQGKHDNIINKFRDILNSIDWEKYSAEEIIELLKREDITDKVLNRIDSFEDFEKYYKDFIYNMYVRYEYLPVELREPNLSEFYMGESLLSYAGDFTLDPAQMFDRLRDELDGRIGSTLSSLLDSVEELIGNKTYDRYIDFDLTLPKINKIQYVADMDGDGEYEEVLKEGMLPEGVYMNVFGPKTVKCADGKERKVLYWVDADAELDVPTIEDSVNTMPDKDFRVRPVFNEEITIEIVDARLVAKNDGFDPAGSEVHYVFTNEEKNVEWAYELKGVSTYGKTYTDEELKSLVTIETTGTLKETAVGKYTSKFAVTAAETNKKEFIEFKDADGNFVDDGLTVTADWTIEKAKIEANNIKLGSNEEFFTNNDNDLDIFFADTKGGTHTVLWQYDLAVSNNYGKVWTKEMIENSLDITVGGTTENNAVDTQFTTTLAIALKTGLDAGIEFESVNKEGVWKIVGAIAIDLNGAKWMYEGKELSSDTVMIEDGKAKVLTIDADDTIEQYFKDGVLVIEYYDENGTKLNGAPVAAGNYTAKVALGNVDGYVIGNNIDDAEFTIQPAPVTEKKPIDLSDAKWQFEGKDLVNNKVEVVYDGKAKALTVVGNEVIDKFFESGVLAIVYYEGETALTEAPSKVGTYTVKVELKDTDNYEITVALQDATLVIKEEGGEVSGKTKIDLGNAKWQYDGKDLADNKVEVTYDGNAKALTVLADETITKLFESGVLAIVYYEGETALTEAPSKVGTYTVKVELKDADNYEITVALQDATLVIKEEGGEVSGKTKIDLGNAKWMFEGKEFTADTVIIADGKAKALTIDADDIIEKYFTDGVLVIEYYDHNGVKLNGAPSEAGEYIVKVALTDTTNYTIVNNIADAKLVITAKQMSSHWGMIALTVGIAAVLIVGLVLLDLLFVSKKNKQ